MSSQPNLISVFVDGVEVKVAPGTNMVEAARLAKIEVPHYCYHPKLTIAGNCRMCLVEMGTPMVDQQTKQPVLDENGKQKIGWMPRPVIACATNATPGLNIRTTTPQVKECREGVMEFLLVNHPLDCPICDQAGECSLQEYATDYGRGSSRFVERKNVKPKRTRLGQRVTLDDERCILCSRCIRFSREIAGEDVLGFTDRGSYSTLTCFPGKNLDHNYSLNTVDICPVGALTSTDFRFKMRVWFLKETNSICTESSIGSNTVVSSREGKIYRITPRRNDAVNDTWMTDSGRDLYKQVESPDRLTHASTRGSFATAEDALRQAATILQSGPVAVVGSGRASVEEQFLLKELAQRLNAVRTDLVARTAQGDGLLLSADRNPNVRGALVTGLISELPSSQLLALGDAIDAGHVKVILSHGEDLADTGLTEDQIAKVSIVYLGTHSNPTSVLATVVVPGLTVFEKSGSLLNQQFRLQRFAQAVPGPVGVLPDIASLSFLTSLLDGNSSRATSPQQVWDRLSSTVPALSGITFATIGDEGRLIDATAWENLPFIEGKSLKYTPKAPEAVTA